MLACFETTQFCSSYITLPAEQQVLQFLWANVRFITDVITEKQGVKIGKEAVDDQFLKTLIKSEKLHLILLQLVYVCFPLILSYCSPKGLIGSQIYGSCASFGFVSYHTFSLLISVSKEFATSVIALLLIDKWFATRPLLFSILHSIDS